MVREHRATPAVREPALDAAATGVPPELARLRENAARATQLAPAPDGPRPEQFADILERATRLHPRQPTAISSEVARASYALGWLEHAALFQQRRPLLPTSGETGADRMTNPTAHDLICRLADRLQGYAIAKDDDHSLALVAECRAYLAAQQSDHASALLPVTTPTQEPTGGEIKE